MGDINNFIADKHRIKAPKQLSSNKDKDNSGQKGIEESKLENYISECSDLINELKNLKSEFKNEIEQIRDEKEEIKSIKKTIHRKKEEIDKLLETIKQHNKNSEESEIKIAKDKEDILTIKSNVEELSWQINVLKKDLENKINNFGYNNVIEENVKSMEVNMQEEQKPRIVQQAGEDDEDFDEQEEVEENEEQEEEMESKNASPGIGLDVGTGFLVGAGYTDSGISYRSIRDAFISINKNQFNPKLFNKSNLNYIEIEDTVFIVGDDAMDFAQIRNSAAQRPLSNGILNPKEKSSAPVLREMFRHVIQAFVKHENEKLCFSVPGPQVGNPDFDVSFHSMSIQSLAKSFNVDAKPVNEAFAVAVSELGEVDASSALSFSFGAGLINAALTFKGMSVFEFSIDKSGDFIDRQAAKGIGESESLICKIKEKKLDLTKNEYVVGAEERALMFSYRHVIQNVLSEVKKAVDEKEDVRILDDIPIVISGGTSMPPGFIDLFKQELNDFELPFGVSEVIHAKDPLKTVAKGCLILANSEY